MTNDHNERAGICAMIARLVAERDAATIKALDAAKEVYRWPKEAEITNEFARGMRTSCILCQAAIEELQAKNQ